MSKSPAQSARGFWYRLIAVILRPILLAATARDWRGGEFLRVDRGIVVAMNHLSWYDPLVAAHFVNDNGRPVRFLAKVEVFKIPLLGSILKSAGQIPVQRGNSDAAAGSLRQAFSAIEDKQCVVIYPEGTLTRAQSEISHPASDKIMENTEPQDPAPITATRIMSLLSFEGQSDDQEVVSAELRRVALPIF